MRRELLALDDRPLLAKRGALDDAKSMLFVDDAQAEPRELHAFAEQRLCAHSDVEIAILEASLGDGARLLSEAAGDDFDTHAERQEQLLERAPMLLSE